MRFEHEAAFIEMMVEHVQIKMMHYLFDLYKEFPDSEELKDRMDKVDHWVRWFTKECEHDLIVPRGRHGYSFQDLRNDEALKNDHPATCIKCRKPGFPFCSEHLVLPFDFTNSKSVVE